MSHEPCVSQDRRNRLEPWARWRVRRGYSLAVSPRVFVASRGALLDSPRDAHGGRTRHYFGWYALNVLELPPHVIALHFGHRDGGELVRKNYGHPDAALSRERVRESFKQAPAAPVRLHARVA